jgi:GNAT superfamily N-acetyltransferase
MAACECGYPTYGYQPPHPEQHDAWESGLSLPPSASEIVIGHWLGGPITFLPPSAPRDVWDQFGEAIQMANREGARSFSFKVGLDGLHEREQQGLLGRSGERVAGLLAFEWRAGHLGFQCWNDQPCEWAEAPDARWVVRFVWVLLKYRRRGLGRQLVEAAASVARVPAAEFAWDVARGAPTPEGEALIQRYCPVGYWRVVSGHARAAS